MRAFLVGVVLAVASVFVGPVRPAAAGDYPPETGIAAGQLLIGTLTASVFVVLPVFGNNTPFETVMWAAQIAGPAAVGGMVCTFGHTSKHYTGGCGPVVLGAYLGALAVVPFTLIGSAAGGSFHDEEGNANFTSGAAIGYAIGYAVGAAVGATIAWHLEKEERSLWSNLGAPPAAPCLESRRWLELAWRRTSGGRAAPATSVPLLAFPF